MEEVKESGAEDENKVSDDSDESGEGAEAKPLSVQRRCGGPARRSTKGGWTEEEDNILSLAVLKFRAKNWKSIAENVPGRTSIQCLHRWQKVLDPNLVKGPWSKEEDDLLIELVREQGSNKWSEMAKRFPGRIGKQCRERWHNHLKPEIKRTAWTKEEESTLVKAQEIYGNKWAEIAKFLPGRTENSIKNLWNCSVSKKLKLLSNSDKYSSNAKEESRTSLLKHSFDPNIKPETERSWVTHAMDLVLEITDKRDSHLQTDCKLARMEENDVIIKPPNGDISLDSPDNVDTDTSRSLSYENASRPVTLSSNHNRISVACQSPEFVLRSIAKTYKNMPSIIRKRRLPSAKQTGIENDFDRKM